MGKKIYHEITFLIWNVNEKNNLSLTVNPRSEINQSPVRQAHGPEVLEGKKSSLMSIRPRQIPVSSMNQQLTFSGIADRLSKCR